MYRFSRGIYRELAGDIAEEQGPWRSARNHELVVRACEAAIRRLATDRRYFAQPARKLFDDIRPYFPISAQQRVWRVVERYMACADEFLARAQRHGFDINGNPLQCRATARKGMPCQRLPLINGYCPSHQHLAETEHGLHQEPLPPLAA